jgi:hypothetical protein
MKMCLTRIPPRGRLNGVFERRRKRDHRGRFRDGPLPYPVVGRKRSVTGLADVSEEGPDLTTTLLASTDPADGLFFVTPRKCRH